MANRNNQPIGIELVKRGIVTEDDIKTALEYQKDHPDKKIGDILYILETCDPNKLIESSIESKSFFPTPKYPKGCGKGYGSIESILSIKSNIFS